MDSTYTHRVAVIAYIIHNDKFLLLKRNNPPQIWGPPGGRLEINENPEVGVVREVSEETGLEIEIIAPAYIWYGNFGSGIYISIDYLAKPKTIDVNLSNEHSAFLWASLVELRAGSPVLSEKESGFKYKDFEKVWELYQKLR